MRIRRNKILFAIFLVLVLTVNVSIMMAPIAKAETVEPMATVFDVSPNLVAVNDQVIFTWDIEPDPPSGYFYSDIALSLEMPDGTKEIFGPFMTNESGGVSLSFVPPWIGTYSGTLSYSGQVLGEDDYLPFLAGPIYLDVVNDLLRVHNPATGLDYATIQDAIDAPETLDGHAILVDSGTYHENVAVTKSVALIGENSNNTIIDGGRNSSPVFNINNLDNVEISGFTIQNGQKGIFIQDSRNSSFSGNKINNNHGGIHIDYSDNCTVSGNTITQNTWSGIYLLSSNNSLVSGNSLADNSIIGVHILLSENNVVSGNTVTNSTNEDIYFSGSHDCIASGNIVTNSGTIGVSFSDSYNVTVSENSITNSDDHGIAAFHSTNSTISGNTITASQYTGIYISISENIVISENNVTNCTSAGMNFIDSNNNTFSDNNATDNSTGVSLSNSSYNTVSGNNIANSTAFGIYLFESKANNFYSNNFTNNLIQVVNINVTCSNTWDNGTEGNYWSDYLTKYPDAAEVGTSGIGDTPYIIDENNQDNYPIMPQVDSVIPEISSWTPIVCMLALAVAIVIHKRRASKK
jgi:parallel beta-helix repeat protein